MARIFITGSADGLGQLAAKQLVAQGHRVVLHARNAERAKLAMDNVPGADNALVADLSNIEETKKLAAEVNAIGQFDVIIHNAGVYQVAANLTFAVNTLAPYILTALIHKPKRIIYLSSELYMGGNPDLINLDYKIDRTSYSDSKMQVLMLCKAVARKWPEVFSNAVDPGWVPTKMGGKGAPDNLEEGFQTQIWLAVSDDQQARVSGRYFHHLKEAKYLAATDDIHLQEKLLAICEQLSGIPFLK